MAAEPEPERRPDGLRVALLFADAARRQELGLALSRLGHSIAPIGTADVVLTDSPATLEPGVAAVALGEGVRDLAGILPTEADILQIDAALHAVAAGLVVRAAPRYFGSAESGSAPLLTPREIEVLVALSDGLSNKHIARRFDISQHTVKFHIESIFRKLAVTTRAEAVAKGLRRGLVHL